MVGLPPFEKHCYLDSFASGGRTAIRRQVSMFHRVFFNSIIDRTPTHALFIQHYISLAC